MFKLKEWTAQEDREEGFNLVELLVVIVIIGIIAAIAITSFLNQRKKAFDASAKSDLHNLRTYLTGEMVEWNNCKNVMRQEDDQLVFRPDTEGGEPDPFHLSDGVQVITTGNHESTYTGLGNCDSEVGTKHENGTKCFYWNGNTGSATSTIQEYDINDEFCDQFDNWYGYDPDDEWEDEGEEGNGGDWEAGEWEDDPVFDANAQAARDIINQIVEAIENYKAANNIDKYSTLSFNTDDTAMNDEREGWEDLNHFYNEDGFSVWAAWIPDAINEYNRNDYDNTLYIPLEMKLNGGNIAHEARIDHWEKGHYTIEITPRTSEGQPRSYYDREAGGYRDYILYYSSYRGEILEGGKYELSETREQDRADHYHEFEEWVASQEGQEPEFPDEDLPEIPDPEPEEPVIPEPEPEEPEDPVEEEEESPYSAADQAALKALKDGEAWVKAQAGSSSTFVGMSYAGNSKLVFLNQDTNDYRESPNGHIPEDVYFVWQYQFGTDMGVQTAHRNGDHCFFKSEDTNGQIQAIPKAQCGGLFDAFG